MQSCLTGNLLLCKLISLQGTRTRSGVRSLSTRGTQDSPRPRFSRVLRVDCTGTSEGGLRPTMDAGKLAVNVSDGGASWGK